MQVCKIYVSVRASVGVRMHVAHVEVTIAVTCILVCACIHTRMHQYIRMVHTCMHDCPTGGTPVAIVIKDNQSRAPSDSSFLWRVRGACLGGRPHPVP
jgi:hypothetical protein